METQHFTEDEAELYDRQIRLWGFGAQKRLRVARILIINLQGLGSEVTKNIVLCGVKSLTILDSGVVTEEDVNSQFLVPHNRIGMNRAMACIERCQQLNPMVELTADTCDLEDKSDAFFLNFDVIFATKCSVHQLNRVNEVCRQNNILFYCGDVFGMFGYVFVDLNEHSYTLETSVFIDGVMSKNVAEQTSIFSSLQDGLDVDWKNDVNAKRRIKMDPSYFFMKVLLRFRGEQGRDPSLKTRTEDLALLELLCPKELAQMDIPTDKIPKDFLVEVFSESTPVCAILGGIAAQEIIKGVSRNEPPINNFFFFNPLTCAGFTEHIGKDVE